MNVLLPLGVVKATTGIIGSLVGVGSEIIALGLDEIGRNRP